MKKTTVDVQLWTKEYDSAFDGPTVAYLEIFPQREGSRLTSGVKFVGKATAEQKRSRKARTMKPDVFHESGQALRDRIAGLAREGWKLDTKRVRVNASDAPRGPSDGDLAREQYDAEIRKMGRR